MSLRRRHVIALTATPILSTLSPLAMLLPAAVQAATKDAKPDASKLPLAPVRNVPETFFGTTVDDPYRDFENIKAPAVAAWMKAHSNFANATLKRIAGRDALRAKLEKYDSAAASRVTAV